MQSIDKIFWYDGEEIRPFKNTDLGTAFKWILVEKEGVLLLLAMPGGTGLDFHKELRDKACEVLGWNIDKLKVLGGGVKLSDGEIYHRSTYFGGMPREYQEVILRLLGLK